MLKKTLPMTNMQHGLAVAIKKLVYFGRGEPYRFSGQILRFVPGTRPIRLKYENSTVRQVRDDVMQIKLIETELGEGDTAIDVGAHYGVFSILMAARCGHTGKVISFEPDPIAREVLEKNIELNAQLKPPVIENAALSDETGKGILFSRGGNSQSSLVRSAVEFSPAHRSEQIEVPLETLDHYLERHDIMEPRWVKIDAEGAEIRILRGAPNLLASRAGILCELHPYAWAEFNTQFSEFKDIVRKSGRRIRAFDGGTDLGEEAEYGTVILERKS